MKSFLWLAVWAVALLAGPGLGVAAIPAIPEVTGAVAQARPDLAQERETLMEERTRLRQRTERHNADCSAVEEGSAADRACSDQAQALSGAIARHVADSRGLIKRIGFEVERQRVIAAMADLARRLDWPLDEQDRLHLALRNLAADGADDVGAEDIRAAWLTIIARGQDPRLAALADLGGGPGFPGAGTQSFEDCAIFALAGAASLPYGVVAARAAKLIAEGDWRRDAERADPERTIKTGGLIGGEVVMLAEVFGQAVVINATDFAGALRGGHRIMVNVVPQNGDVDGGHQVVLSRTFVDHDQVWFEMIDSNAGPQARYFLSAAELAVIQQENGVIVRPDPDRTPIGLK